MVNPRDSLLIPIFNIQNACDEVDAKILLFAPQSIFKPWVYFVFYFKVERFRSKNS